MAKAKSKTCGARAERGKACNLPAGFGVEGSEGEGPCMYHRKAWVEISGKRVETTHDHAMELSSKGGIAFKMVGGEESRMAELLEEMGARLHIDKKRGASHMNLDFELCFMRAVMILVAERFEFQQGALERWVEAYDSGDVKAKPPRVLGVGDLHKSVEGVVKIVQTMHVINQSIPKDKFLRVLQKIGEIIKVHVDDKKVLGEIRRDLQEAVAEFVVT